MRKILYFSSYIAIGIAGIWLVQHESVSQEILSSLVLIVVSIIAVFTSLKSLTSER